MKAISTYVIGDIHGCYDDFQRMLEKIAYFASDRLILVGDYIDRGTQSMEMLRWLEQCPENTTPLRGNHDEEFACYVDLMWHVNAECGLETEPDSHEDAGALYDTTKYIFRKRGLQASLFFDRYGTLGRLLSDPSVTFKTLTAWAEMIRNMPYFIEFSAAGKPCVAVHAGFRRDLEGADAEEFYLYAREDAYAKGGITHGMVIAGHTPTTVEGEFTYNNGHVFRYYDAQKDCVFYDVDCGCVFRTKRPNAHLACIRVEDETVFYI